MFSEISLISKRAVYTVFFVPFCDFAKYQSGKKLSSLYVNKFKEFVPMSVTIYVEQTYDKF